MCRHFKPLPLFFSPHIPIQQPLPPPPPSSPSPPSSLFSLKNPSLPPLVNYDTIIDVASSSEDAIDALDIVEEQSPFDDTSDDDDTADADEEPSFIPLKDPDGVSVTGLIKGDKILHKTLLNELKGATLSLRKVAGKLINDCNDEEEEMF
ncbi:hypothetical protein AHAS_Ahas18G0074900 [Arachis hypogaea]